MNTSWSYLPKEFSSRQGRVLPLQREDIGVLPVSGEAAGFAVNEVVPRKFTPSVKRQRVFLFSMKENQYDSF